MSLSKVWSNLWRILFAYWSSIIVHEGGHYAWCLFFRADYVQVIPGIKVGSLFLASPVTIMGFAVPSSWGLFTIPVSWFLLPLAFVGGFGESVYWICLRNRWRSRVWVKPFMSLFTGASISYCVIEVYNHVASDPLQSYSFIAFLSYLPALVWYIVELCGVVCLWLDEREMKKN